MAAAVSRAAPAARRSRALNWRSAGDDDWPHTFELVVSSDTVYSDASLASFVALVARVLHADGVALVAAKSYYFGVGGGTLALRRALAATAERDGRRLTARVLVRHSDGVSNVREVLHVSWQPTER